jgi:hypothetical protein
VRDGVGIRNYFQKLKKRTFQRGSRRRASAQACLQGDGYEEETFKDVETFCMFIGYPRSGHSVVGSLIDAHPDAVLSSELDALKYVREGCSRKEIFPMILRRSERFVVKRRRTPDAEYFVPNQWQGRFRTLRVIGDKKGAGSAIKFNKDPELLDRFQRVIGGSIKFIHVVRNPYDTISTMSIRNGKGLEFSSKRFFMLCRAVEKVKERVDPSTVLDVRHESLIADPEGVVKELCRFLGLEPFDDYVKDCAGIIYQSPNRSRSKVEWSAGFIASVKERMAGFPHLAGYSFEE